MGFEERTRLGGYLGCYSPGDQLVALIEQEALVEVDVRMAKSVRLSQDRVGMRGSELSEGAPAKGAEGDERPEHARW